MGWKNIETLTWFYSFISYIIWGQEDTRVVQTVHCENLRVGFTATLIQSIGSVPSPSTGWATYSLCCTRHRLHNADRAFFFPPTHTGGCLNTTGVIVTKNDPRENSAQQTSRATEGGTLEKGNALAWCVGVTVLSCFWHSTLPSVQTGNEKRRESQVGRLGKKDRCRWDGWDLLEVGVETPSVISHHVRVV